MAAACRDAASLYRLPGRWLGAWAIRRSLSPNSVAGMSLLLATCAGAWFSAGTGADSNRGLIAMAGWLVALGAARSLAALTATKQVAERTPAGGAVSETVRQAAQGSQAGRQAATESRPVMRVAGARYVGTEWLVLPGVIWADGEPAVAGPAGRAVGDTVGPNLAIGGLAGSRFGWLAGVCSAAGECAVYGGIAAGGSRGATIGMWPLAVMTVAAVAVAEMLAASRAVAAAGSRSPPLSARALIAAAGLAIAGSQAALFAVLAVELISIAGMIATLGRVAPHAPDRTRTVSSRMISNRTVSNRAVPTRTGQTRAVLLALRDDGAAARWAGRLVQGMLIPLPPAFAGLIATALLAALGIHNLPGFIAMTPPVVMMLAAPGSSHPHDGRFDWLAPVLLVAVQYVYFGSVGFARAVPGPVIFSACAMTYVWYAGVIRSAAQGDLRGGQNRSSGPGSAIGWESRMFTVGLAATLGLATFGYVVLAASLGAFIGRTAIIGYLVTTEDDRR